MSATLMNRAGFTVPEDGFYHLAPLGEFAHAQAGVLQIIDQEACESMVNSFRQDAEAANFPGILVDFDHFSLDGEKRSEAAGWITALENRDTGLYAKIRWSDLGEEAVKGGRYRFLSPVWGRAECTDLGDGRLRPLKLLNAAVTNDPNLKGMAPLSNSASLPPPSCAPSRPILLLANIGWQDEARTAALAVRKAKAAARGSTAPVAPGDTPTSRSGAKERSRGGAPREPRLPRQRDLTRESAESPDSAAPAPAPQPELRPAAGSLREILARIRKLHGLVAQKAALRATKRVTDSSATPAPGTQTP